MVPQNVPQVRARRRVTLGLKRIQGGNKRPEPRVVQVRLWKVQFSINPSFVIQPKVGDRHVKRIQQKGPVKGYRLFRYEKTRPDGTTTILSNYYIRRRGKDISTGTDRLPDARIAVKKLAGRSPKSATVPRSRAMSESERCST